MDEMGVEKQLSEETLKSLIRSAIDRASRFDEEDITLHLGIVAHILSEDKALSSKAPFAPITPDGAEDILEAQRNSMVEQIASTAEKRRLDITQEELSKTLVINASEPHLNQAVDIEISPRLPVIRTDAIGRVLLTPSHETFIPARAAEKTVSGNEVSRSELDLGHIEIDTTPPDNPRLLNYDFSENLTWLMRVSFESAVTELVRKGRELAEEVRQKAYHVLCKKPDLNKETADLYKVFESFVPVAFATMLPPGWGDEKVFLFFLAVFTYLAKKGLKRFCKDSLDQGTSSPAPAG
ncbi:hypothetical protein GTO91_16750 [Heliobacterium undosum]|uniref:Uncharacterized protein n=1 Tax=Heliomicrobium undosum TaxID=121734 RepID=A0A845LEJ8_9FIRM|nr:hypothetical protein [Heliomicrobium undosum]MZP31351.1 hypothetical protein [Heliomicrobium undosum]